jgi:hypothetical protein
VLASEKDGHMRRRFIQTSSTVGGVGTLPGLDRTRDIGQPPAGPGQPVKGCRRLLVRQLGLEGGSSLDVTAGRRFVLLSFLFGEEASRPE